MNLADKIMCLRKQKGWSQEEFAMRLDVSRQSVSKWESDQSLPDMNKIVAMSSLFNVTTDYLLKEELTEEHANLDEEEMELIVPKALSNIEVRDFLKAVKVQSKKIAIGVALCIFGAMLVVFFAGTAEVNTMFNSPETQLVVGIVSLFILVATAVGIFITTANQMSEYNHISQSVLSIDKRTKEDVLNEYVVFKKMYNLKVAFSVILLILGVVPLIVGGLYNISEYNLILLVDVLLLCAAISVFTLVKESLRLDGYKNLLNKGEKSLEAKKLNKQIESINGIYWPLVVAIYLGWSFYTQNWHITWVVWPVAGIISSIIPEIIKLKNIK